MFKPKFSCFQAELRCKSFNGLNRNYQSIIPPMLPIGGSISFPKRSSTVTKKKGKEPPFFCVSQFLLNNNVKKYILQSGGTAALKNVHFSNH